MIKREAISNLLSNVWIKEACGGGGGGGVELCGRQTDHTPHLASPPLQGHLSFLWTSTLMAWVCVLNPRELSFKTQIGFFFGPVSKVRLIYSCLSLHALTHVWHTSLRTRVSPKSPWVCCQFNSVGVDLRRAPVTSLLLRLPTCGIWVGYFLYID